MHFVRRSGHLVYKIIHNYTVLLYNLYVCDVDVCGNEEVGRTAKAAFHISIDAYVPYTVSKIFDRVRQYSMLKWQIRWNQSSYGRLLYGMTKRLYRDMATFGKNDKYM